MTILPLNEQEGTSAVASTLGMAANSPTQVLVVEDSAVYRKLIRERLNTWGFSTSVVTNGSDAWKALGQPESPKLVLLDWMLPDLEGIELCQRIREAGYSRPYVYVILLTSKGAHQDMLEAMNAGVDDYLIKPFDDSTLRARLLVGERILNLQDQLIAAREMMTYAATHDSLTGLTNRKEILEVLQKELERAKRENKCVAVLLADVDHFKQVNDSLGHLFGDAALREVARRLRANLRVYDGIGRYGGEEFLLVLPGCNLTSARFRGDALLKRIARAPVVYSGAKQIITLSVGIAVSDGPGGQDVHELLSQADAGLYAAKRNGRNRVEYVPQKARNQHTSRCPVDGGGEMDSGGGAASTSDCSSFAD